MQIQSLNQVWEIPWNRKWQSALVFLPGKYHGQRSLMGYSPLGQKESDTAQHLNKNILEVFHYAVCSVMSDSLRSHGPVTRQAPLSLGYSRQEYWSGLPFPPPGDLTDPGIEPMFPASPALEGRFFTTGPSRKPFQRNRSQYFLNSFELFNQIFHFHYYF